MKPIQIAYNNVTEKLGPGSRSALWVSGCSRRCEGCIAPEYQNPAFGQSWTNEELVVWMVSGNGRLTLSGGEPMEQAAQLNKALKLAAEVRTIETITFTGYTLDQIIQNGDPDQLELVSLSDLLVHGAYVQALHCDQYLKGSSNQEFHFSSNVYRWIADSPPPSSGIEIEIDELAGLSITGVPPIPKFRSELHKHLRQRGIYFNNQATITEAS